MIKPSVIVGVVWIIWVSEAISHSSKLPAHGIKQHNQILYSTTDNPVLLPETIHTQAPVFFPMRSGLNRESEETNRVVPWGDIEALMVYGFMIPIVKPKGESPHLPDLGSNGDHNSPDDQENQEILEGILNGNNSVKASGLNIRNSVHREMKVEVTGSDPVMCGNYELRTGNRVTIQTPYYPKNYASNFQCQWTLTVLEGDAMMINCPSFQLAQGDILTTVVVGQPKTLSKYMWGKGPVNNVLESTTVKLSFKSNKKKNSKGFSCIVTALGSSTTTTVTTTTKTPSTTTTTTPEPTTTTTKTPTTTTTTTKAPTTTTSITTTTEAPTTTTSSTTTTEGTTTTTIPTTTLPPLSFPDCGITNRAPGRIVNGQAAIPNEYPWQSFLEIKWSDGKNQLCGGSLITKQWILTAGHCVLRKHADGTLWKPNVDVTLGMHTRTSPLANGGFKLTAAAVEIHPKNNFAFDLALIKLPREVEFKREVRPVCLPNRSLQGRNVTGVLMALVGWGKTETGQLTTELRELGRYGIEAAICKKVFGAYITDHHFCTSGTDVKHICLGDSGGPVMTVDRGRFTLTGVVSFVATKDCKGEYPDGHVSVTSFLDWIQDMTKHTIY